MDGCASQTFCGDILVPEHHLHVSDFRLTDIFFVDH